MQESGKKKQAEETYICPKEAVRKLKTARKLRSAAYLYGVTGIGKTALIREFLGRRRYEYYSAKETEPEQIRVRDDGKDHIVVIDDLYSVTSQRQREEYRERIKAMLDQERVWLILISRSPVPRWLFPLYVEYVFTVISEKNFYLTREEQKLYLEAWNIHLNEKDEEKTWELGHGHPVALRLLALEKGDIESAVKDMWIYLETHVYDQWDVELQDFLMETSIVDNFTRELAGMITGRSNVEGMIAQAEEIGNFLELAGENGIWQYRWPMRQSMRNRLQKKYSDEKIRHLYYHAGLYYELHDRYPEALEMYQKYQETESISRVLTANARKNPASGQYFQLRKYYLSLPEERIMTSSVLMACMSMLHSMLMNEQESERWYHNLGEFAKNSTGSARREAGSYLLYLDISLPHRGNVNLVDILKHAGNLMGQRKVALPEFSVTSNLPSLMNGGKDFCEWSKKDKELAASIGKPVELVLGKYGRGIVPLALAESGLEKGMDSYEVMRLAEKGKMCAESGGKAEQCFVAVGILVWLSVQKGNAEYGEEILQIFRKRAEEDAPWLIWNLEAFLCRCRLYQGKSAEAGGWMAGAPNELEEFCTMERFRYLTKVRVYLQSGRYERAYGLIQQLLYYAEHMKRTYISMEAKLLLAVVLYRMDRKEWREAMQECIASAEEYHFVRVISREGGAALELLKAGGFVWRDPKFQEQVLRECEQMAAFYPNYLKEGADGEVLLPENALKILRMQAEGFPVKEIAVRLGISEATVKYHNKETYRKLGVNSKVAAVNEARKRKLI